jgi:hypothetical protein
MQILSAINRRGHSKKNPIAALAGPAIDNETTKPNHPKNAFAMQKGFNPQQLQKRTKLNTAQSIHHRSYKNHSCMLASPNQKEIVSCVIPPFFFFSFYSSGAHQPCEVSFQLTTLYVASRLAVFPVAMSSLTDKTSRESAASAVDASEGAAVPGTSWRRG